MKTTTIKQELRKEKNLKAIKETMQSKFSIGRTELARFLCEKFNFIDRAGRLQISSCQKALYEFDTKGLIRLPEKRKTVQGKWAPKRLGHAVPIPEGIPQSVERIDKIDLILVDTKNTAQMKIHNELICSEHPLGDKRIAGRQLRYLIKSEHGFLGAISFSSAALFLEDRDKWLGWKSESITKNRDYIINMSRFLIRNSINCKNLASHILGKCVKQMPDDFEARYGYRPLIIETFVDTDHYKGTCYKASNWKFIGQTKGRGRDDRYYKYEKSIKDIYIYPLVENFRELMNLPDKDHLEITSLAITEGMQTGKWAEQEFGSADIGDDRLTSRLIQIVENKANSPGASYLQGARGERYMIKGYYNFVDNERDTVNFKSILYPHKERTIQRMKAIDTVLCIQDTTGLNYSKINGCEGLGPIGKNQTGTEAKGLFLHSSLVVDKKGLPVGILEAKCYASDPTKVKKKKSEKRNTPIQEKESYRWIEGYKECVRVSKLIPDTRIVNVMDREADMYELFEEVDRSQNRVPVLLRAQHNRVLVDSKNKLFNELKQSNIRFQLEIDIPPQRERKNKKGKCPYLAERKGILDVRYKKITLKPPESPIIKNRKPISLMAVYATEINPPKGAKKIDWFLLTTLDVCSDEMASTCIEWYRRRWRVEEWHRVLKTGCGIEKYKNKSAERIKRILAIDMVIGWRAMLLTLCGREMSGAPAELLFNKDECKIISNLCSKKN